MVIDYSKWDNIDTDSDEEVAAPQPTKPLKPQAAQQAPTQATQTSAPVPDQSSDNAPSGNEQIKAVIVRCNGDTSGPKWSETTINNAHPIFEQPPGSEAPLPAALGIPLIFHRLPSSHFDTQISSLNNQMMTYINIELESGLAPLAWDSQVGTVLVARSDKKPLLEQHIEAVWMYCDRILDLFGYGDGAPRHLYNRPAFEKWWAGYVEEMRDLERDDWVNVPTPYQV